MTLISDLHADVLRIVVSWLEWSEIFRLASTRDTRLLTRLVHSQIVNKLYINLIPEKDLHLQFWLLRNLNFIEEVVFAEFQSNTGAFLPILASKPINSVVIKSSLYDPMTIKKMRQYGQSLFSVVLIEPALVPVPVLRPLFPSLLHLTLDIPIDKIFKNAGSIRKYSRAAWHRADRPNPYLELFRELPSGLLSLEITNSSHSCAITAKSLVALPGSLTKLKVHQTSSPDPLSRNTLYLTNVSQACPNLGELDINWTNLSRLSISMEDRKSEKPLGYTVCDPFPQYLVSLSLSLTRPRVSARISFPETLRSLKLINPDPSQNQVLFGLDNLLHPVLPNHLESLHLSGISLCFANLIEVAQDRNSYPSLRLPRTLTSLNMDRYDTILPMGIGFVALDSLRYLSFHRPYSKNDESASLLPVPAPNMFQSHSLLRLELDERVRLSAYDVSLLPTQLRALQATPETLIVLLLMLDHMPDCHFGKMNLYWTPNSLAWVAERAVLSGDMEETISPKTILAFLREAAAPRCAHLRIQFPKGREGSPPLSSKNTLKLAAAPVTNANFVNVTSSLRSRTVYLDSHSFDPSFFSSFPCLTTMKFQTDLTLTNTMIETLPRTLTYFDALDSPIESPLDFSAFPRSLTYLKSKYKLFRVDGVCLSPIASSALQELIVPHIYITPKHLMCLMSRDMRQLHFSTSAHDVDVARVVGLIPAGADWSIRGYIHITGLLIDSKCENVDYEVICQSALDVIDKTRKHTKKVTFRASPELVFPLNVKSASLIQKQLKGWAPSDDMLETRLPSNIVGIGLNDTAAVSDDTLTWLFEKSTDTLPQPKLSGGMSWVIGYALERLHLEIVRKQVTLSDFIVPTLPKLCYLSLIAPIKGKCDIPHSLKSLEIENTGNTPFVVELRRVPLTLEELVLKTNCNLRPPPDEWHHTMKRLSFTGGKPWTDAHALILQQSLPRHAVISIGTLGFSGALIGKSAEHLSWEIMLRDTIQGLPRVSVGAFDIAITEPLPLLVGNLPRLRSLHINPNDVSLHVSKRSSQLINTDTGKMKVDQKSTTSTNTSVSTSIIMDQNQLDSDMVAIDVDDAADDLPPLLNADQFPLRRLPAPPSSLQELEMENSDSFFPSHLLSQIPNLRFSHLVRLILNIPMRIHGALGTDLPRSLVTLSMPKAAEDPAGIPIKLFDLPPGMVYISVPKLLLDPPTVAYIPRSLKLLKAFNSVELARALSLSDPRMAELLFPQPPDTPSPSRSKPSPNSARGSGNATTPATPSHSTPNSNSNSRPSLQKSSPTSPTTRKMRHQPIDLIALDDYEDDDILAPYTPNSKQNASSSLNPNATSTPLSSSSSSAIRTPYKTSSTTPASTSPSTPLKPSASIVVIDDDGEDVLSPLPHPGSKPQGSSSDPPRYDPVTRQWNS